MCSINWYFLLSLLVSYWSSQIRLHGGTRYTSPQVNSKVEGRKVDAKFFTPKLKRLFFQTENILEEKSDMNMRPLNEARSRSLWREREEWAHCRGHASPGVTNSRTLCVFKPEVLYPGNPFILWWIQRVGHSTLSSYLRGQTLGDGCRNFGGEPRKEKNLCWFPPGISKSQVPTAGKRMGK